MVKAKYERPCVYEKEERDEKDDLRTGAEAEEIFIERHKNPENGEVRFVVRKIYKPDFSERAEGSGKIWKILESNDFNVPAYYFLTEERGRKVILMEFLGGEGEEVNSFHLIGSGDPCFIFGELDNLQDLAQKTIEDLARMHRLNIAIGDTPLSPWFLKFIAEAKKGKLFLGDLSNLQLLGNLDESHRKRDLRGLIDALALTHRFSFKDSSLEDPKEIYDKAYQNFQPKEGE